MQLEDSLLAISPNLLDRINDIARKIMSMIADTYREGVSEGKFIEGHGMVFADSIWGLFNGLILWEESKKKFNPEKDFLKSTLDVAIDIFYRGVKCDNKRASERRS
jgi:hypothetical protein